MKIIAFEFNSKDPDSLTVQVAVEDAESPDEALEKSRAWVSSKVKSGTKPKEDVKKEINDFQGQLLQSFEDFKKKFGLDDENSNEQPRNENLEELAKTNGNPTENLSDDPAKTEPTDSPRIESAAESSSDAGGK